MFGILIGFSWGIVLEYISSNITWLFFLSNYARTDLYDLLFLNGKDKNHSDSNYDHSPKSRETNVRNQRVNVKMLLQHY